ATAWSSLTTATRTPLTLTARRRMRATGAWSELSCGAGRLSAAAARSCAASRSASVRRSARVRALLATVPRTRWLREILRGHCVSNRPASGARSHVKEKIRMRIKFVDLEAQNAEIRSRAEGYIEEVHRDCSYIGGEQVSAFEREFAAFLGVRH